MSTETGSKNDLGIVIEGEQNDLQIIEEGSDGEGALNLPSYRNITDVALPSRSPVFGSVAVTNSENVHFGDRYIKIFNGPVNIKQLVQSGSGENNEAYMKTENENINDSTKSNGVPSQLVVKGDQKLQIQLWHKLIFSVIGISLIGGICALVIILHNRTDDNIVTIDPTLNFDGIHKNFTGELFVSPHHLRIVSRSDWLAQPEVDKLDPIRQPVPWVIITHTATEACYTQSACVLRVRLIQSFHVESRGWFDIGYNFLVGGDGSAYLGRGWDHEGAHTKGYNKYSMGIALIGTFNKDSPTKQQMEACKKLIQLGVEEGKLAKDYKLFAHRQLMSTLSPGDAVYDIVKTWPHFVSNYTTDLIPNY